MDGIRPNRRPASTDAPKGEQNVSPVQRDVFDARCVCGQQTKKDAQARKCCCQAHDACCHAEHDAFRYQLLDEPARRRADGAANGDLALAGRGPRQHQVGHIGAGDEQNQTDGAEEQQKTRPDVARHRLARSGSTTVLGTPRHPACARERA